jgi:hypothetical protein
MCWRGLVGRVPGEHELDPPAPTLQMPAPVSKGEFECQAYQAQGPCMQPDRKGVLSIRLFALLCLLVIADQISKAVVRTLEHFL